MPARRFARSTSGVAAVLSLVFTLASCGEEALPGPPTSKVSPAAAEHALRDYLDHDRCDLLSDNLAETISPNAADGRKQCADGQLPVDAYVKRGEYKITNRDVIDGNGLFSVSLGDGGTRDYVMTPGGPEKFQVDQVTDHTSAKVGEPLRLQARADPTGPLVDARIVVDGIQRVPVSKLGPDEYVSDLSKFYKVHVTETSRRKTLETVGSAGFSLTESHGVKLADSQIPYSNIGGLIPQQLKAGETASGYLFFEVPRVKAAKPANVVFTLGTGDTGSRLTWSLEK